MTRTGATHSRPPAVRSWRRFVRDWGWRAYALPVLTVFTVVVAVQSTGHSRATAEPVKATVPPTVVDTEVDSVQCAANKFARFVLVSISRQSAWMCQGAMQVYASAVTTGDVAARDATPTGSWRVQGKQTDTYLTGPGYRDYVNYWIPFDGEIGFHDATWQTMAFGSPGYTTQGSHGCVHLPMPAVEWLFAWAQIGTTVVTATT